MSALDTPPTPAPTAAPTATQPCSPAAGVDTVANAQAQREATDTQPWQQLGLRLEEYQRICQLLGRRPTSCELAMYAVMWSEHCSYKSSKVHLRRFGQLPKHPAVLAGIGENAGVVDVGDGYAVTFKVESHNHPSFVEPHQGAATGVGGIVRDILAMGARPIAVMDSLRFGPADAPDTKRVLPGVVEGVGSYGNCLGLPNIGGEVAFDATYAGNPLVNALCVGVLRHEDLHLAHASGAGNAVILFGARTGGDGIGGVSVLASASFEAQHEGQAAPKRPSVQVGDPFAKKKLVECTVQVYAEKLVVGVQDLGGAGLSCALTELASAGTGGMRVQLDQVPLRDSSLTPEEILTSESQERMCAIVRPQDVEAFLQVCRHWQVPATVIGEVTDSGTPADNRLEIFWHDQLIVQVQAATVAHDGPTYEREYRRPLGLDALQANDIRSAKLPRPKNGEQLGEQLLALLASPNLCSRAFVTDQYDRYVRGHTALAHPDDAGVVRIAEASPRGIALALDGNGRYTRLDPYTGAQLALAEAYRNVAVTGATPLAVTNCLNFGSPEDPDAMGEFALAVQGLAEGCLALGLPVTGGNVSFYNQTGTTSILPTPVVGVLGVLEDVARRVPMGLRPGSGDAVVLLGTTGEDFGGSEWAHALHQHLGGLPPQVDFDAEQALATLLIFLARQRGVTSAHDLSEAGLGQALAEVCMRHGAGVQVDLRQVHQEAWVALFSESSARALVSVPSGKADHLLAFAQAHEVPAVMIGTVIDEPIMKVQGQFAVSVQQLRQAHTGTLPRLFGGAA